MKILFMLDSPMAWQSGIWLHRCQIPSGSLTKRGHSVRHVAIGKEIPEEFMDYPDTVIFGRTYAHAFNPVDVMRQYKKRNKRVLYDLDDDIWTVSKDNPSSLISNATKDQYEAMIKEADAITTPSRVLAKKFQKLVKGKPVFICPNGIDNLIWKPRPKEHKDLIIGYAGAASHWRDLQLITDALEELHKERNFYFVLFGLTGEPLEAAVYYYDRMLHNNFKPEKNDYFQSALDFYNKVKTMPMMHIPFYPPELYPDILSRADFDIGLIPLEDTEFNRGKSNIKFCEYASIGTVTLSSKVTPYKECVGYCAKNTKKDWYNKLKKLIDDKDFREKLLTKQQDFVKKNHSLQAIGLKWELACQRPGGLKVLNQQDENSSSQL